MNEALALAGALQDGGGLLLLFGWLIVEVRRLRKDFSTHSHGEDGRLFLQVHSEG